MCVSEREVMAPLLLMSCYPSLTMYMCKCVMVLITTLVLCARSQDLVVSVRRVVFSTAGFSDRRKSCCKIRETAAL